MYRWFILLGIFFSCGSRSGGASTGPDTAKAALDTPAHVNPLALRACVPFDPTVMDGPDSVYKAALIRSFPEDMGGVKVSQLLAVRMTEKAVALGDLGACQVYKVMLSPELPEVMEDTLFLVVSKAKGKAALFPLADFRAFMLSPRDSVSLIGGTFLLRGKGSYMVYRYNGSSGFELVLNTYTNPGCPDGVPVYNSSLDCVCYDPFGLRLEVADVNGDGINDLVFSGKVAFYCRGLEMGYGRKDRKPLREKKVRIVFQGAEDQGRPSWNLQDTSICRVLEGK